MPHLVWSQFISPKFPPSVILFSFFLSCNAPTYDTASHAIWMLFITLISLNQSREALTFTLCICMIFAKFCHAKMKTIQNVIIYKLIFTSHLYDQVYKYIVQYHNKGPFTNTCKGGGLMQKILIVKNFGDPPSDLKNVQVPLLAMKILLFHIRRATSIPLGKGTKFALHHGKMSTTKHRAIQILHISTFLFTYNVDITILHPNTQTLTVYM